MSKPIVSIRSAARTDVGKVRKANEDAILEHGNAGLWVVADGMGGHGFGDVASTLVIDYLSEFNGSSGSNVDEAVAQLRSRLVKANDALRNEATRRGKRVIGSTVVMLLIPVDKGDGEAAIIWAGDSRAYRLRDGSLSLLSRDHSYVEELVAIGTLTPEQAIGHPQGHIITRAVGANDFLESDVRKLDLLPGDRFLLCSDGLTRDLDDAVIAEVLEIPDLQTTVDTLVDNALYRGGGDNISVVVVDVDLPQG